MNIQRYDTISMIDGSMVQLCLINLMYFNTLKCHLASVKRQFNSTYLMFTIDKQNSKPKHLLQNGHMKLMYK